MRTTALLLVAGAALALAAPSAAHPRRSASCGAPQVSPVYAHRLLAALRAGRDVWGDSLLSARGGPTYRAARRYLPPLLYASGRGGRRLTASGVYYLPFSLPYSAGPRGFGLHVADGSQILVRRTGARGATVQVGLGGGERFGSCLARTGTPSLLDGYLPVLENWYIDSLGVRYTQESFVGRLPGSPALVSFVHVHADARHARRTASVLLVPTHGAWLGVKAHPGRVVDLYAGMSLTGGRLKNLDEETYATERDQVSSYWQSAVAAAGNLVVPEPAVMNAERAILVQELAMTWRYSVGNAYEELSFAEALDVAEVMARYGFDEVARQILRYTLQQLPRRFTDWRAGERLLVGATYYQLSRDQSYVAEETPILRRVVNRLGRELAAGGNGLLPRQRYSSDIAERVYGLHGQALVWEGLLAMSRVWAQTGQPTLAEKSRVDGLRLQAGLRRAVRRSERRLRDGSLFVPVALLDGEKPFARITASRAGSYWNLVFPFALASGFFPPHGADAQAILRYLLGHGSRLLGLVRSGAYRLSSGESALTSGIDEVYGVNVARFLADNDKPDQLVLSLYGTLAAALTPGTHVSGESASVAPLDGRRYRTMYLPPNNDGGAAFLETLRLMLVHETRGPEGAPRGLELAFATPRAWLAPGKHIYVSALPTSFGVLDYSLERRGDRVLATIEVPDAPVPKTLRLRLRLPAGERVAGVELAGRPVHFDASNGTIDLSGRTGELQLVARVR